jgi:hypothetical protein
VPKHTSKAIRRLSILLPSLALLTMASLARADMSIDGLYDLRHATDPADNRSNFPVIEMKGFFRLSFGAFLFKEEIDLGGTKGNASEVYSELDQSIRLGHATLWSSPLSLHLGYSGGLGVFDHATGGYYVQNAYSAGPEYGFRIAGAYCDLYAAVRYTDIAGATVDPMISFWIGKYFLGYRLLVANSLEAWTTSYDWGKGPGSTPSHRVASWELESEVWYKIARDLSVGTYIRTTRNVYALSDRWVVYPSIGVRYAF